LVVKEKKRVTRKVKLIDRDQVRCTAQTILSDLMGSCDYLTQDRAKNICRRASMLAVELERSVGEACDIEDSLRKHEDSM
jgi:hypothetical protein